MPRPGIEHMSVQLHLSLWGTLIQDALWTEQPRPRHHGFLSLLTKSYKDWLHKMIRRKFLAGTFCVFTPMQALNNLLTQLIRLDRKQLKPTLTFEAGMLTSTADCFTEFVAFVVNFISKKTLLIKMCFFNFSGHPCNVWRTGSWPGRNPATSAWTTSYGKLGVFKADSLIF